MKCHQSYMPLWLGNGRWEKCAGLSAIIRSEKLVPVYQRLQGELQLSSASQRLASPMLGRQGLYLGDLQEGLSDLEVARAREVGLILSSGSRCPQGKEVGCRGSSAGPEAFPAQADTGHASQQGACGSVS